MTNAEAWFNIALRPRKPEGSLGRTAQDGHLDFHTAPELRCVLFRPGHKKGTCCIAPGAQMSETLISASVVPTYAIGRSNLSLSVFNSTGAVTE